MKKEKQLNAVVIDDNLSIAQGRSDQLQRWNFNSTPYHLWAEAEIDLKSGRDIDLLLIDNELNEIDTGIQLVDRLRSAGHLARTKIVVFSGSGDSLEPADKSTSEKWGMDVNTKPLDLSSLMKRLFPNAKYISPQQFREKQSMALRALRWCEDHSGFGQWALGSLAIGLAVLGIWVSIWLANRSGSQAPVSPADGSTIGLASPGIVPKGPPLKVRIAVNPVPLGALPIIADEADYWKAVGLEVELISFPTGKASLDAVLGGGADFATAAETPIMRAGLAGFTPAVLATIASSPDDCKVCYRLDHGITKPSDLKGKKVATAFGTSAEYFMDTFLAHHGIRRDEVTALSMKPAEMVNTLVRGDISAFFIWEPYPLQAGQILKNRAEVFPGSDIYTETFQIVARREYAQKNPEACRRLLRALLKAEEQAMTNQQGAAERVAAFTQLAPVEVSAIWKNFQFRVGLTSEFATLLEKEAAWARASDPSLPQNVPFREFLWPGPLKDVAPDRVSITP